MALIPKIFGADKSPDPDVATDVEELRTKLEQDIVGIRSTMAILKKANLELPVGAKELEEFQNISNMFYNRAEISRKDAKTLFEIRDQIAAASDAIMHSEQDQMVSASDIVETYQSILNDERLSKTTRDRAASEVSKFLSSMNINSGALSARNLKKTNQILDSARQTLKSNNAAIKYSQANRNADLVIRTGRETRDLDDHQVVTPTQDPKNPDAPSRVQSLKDSFLDTPGKYSAGDIRKGGIAATLQSMGLGELDDIFNLTGKLDDNLSQLFKTKDVETSSELENKKDEIPQEEKTSDSASAKSDLQATTDMEETNKNLSDISSKLDSLIDVSTNGLDRIADKQNVTNQGQNTELKVQERVLSELRGLDVGGGGPGSGDKSKEDEKSNSLLDDFNDLKDTFGGKDKKGKAGKVGGKAGKLGKLGKLGSLASKVGDVGGGIAGKLGGAKMGGLLSVATAGYDVYNIATSDAPQEEKNKGYSGAAGGLAGGLAGAQAGATVGALGGPIGIAVGGVVGGLLGSMGGSELGSWLYEALTGEDEDTAKKEREQSLQSDKKDLEAATGVPLVKPEDKVFPPEMPMFSEFPDMSSLVPTISKDDEKKNQENAETVGDGLQNMVDYFAKLPGIGAFFSDVSSDPIAPNQSWMSRLGGTVTGGISSAYNTVAQGANKVVDTAATGIDQLRHASANALPSNAEQKARGEALYKQAQEAGLKGDELASFMGQVSHESGNFKYYEELASGAKYEGRKDLGNTEAGDGRRYKGRGPIQITGRANYKKYGEQLGIDLENNPELASDPEIGNKLAIAYWKDRVQPKLEKNGNSVEVATKAVNGGYNGLEDRKDKTAAWRDKVNKDEASAQAIAESVPAPPTAAQEKEADDKREATKVQALAQAFASQQQPQQAPPSPLVLQGNEDKKDTIDDISILMLNRAILS